MDQANDNLPKFPILMFILALCMCALDLLFTLISFIPFIGFILGAIGGAVSGAIFYSIFFFWKAIYASGSDKLSMSNYGTRAAIGFVFDLIPLLNLFDEPVTVWLTWRKEVAKAKERQAASSARRFGEQNTNLQSPEGDYRFIDTREAA